MDVNALGWILLILVLCFSTFGFGWCLVLIASIAMFFIGYVSKCKRSKNKPRLGGTEADIKALGIFCKTKSMQAGKERVLLWQALYDFKH